MGSLKRPHFLITYLVFVAFYLREYRVARSSQNIFYGKMFGNRLTNIASVNRAVVCFEGKTLDFLFAHLHQLHQKKHQKPLSSYCFCLAKKI
jgi:hypothetical protein